MKNAIFLVAMACLLAGCGEKGPTVMKLKTEANVTSEQGLLVKVMPHDEIPLPIKIVPGEIAVRAFVVFLVAVIAASLAAIAAWRAAYNTEKALEKIKNKIGE